MKKQAVIWALVLSMLAGMVPASAESAAYNVYRQGISYEDYLARLADSAYAAEAIALPGADGAGDENARLRREEGWLYWENAAGDVTWRFTVPRSGRYEIEVTYLPLPGSGASIERTVLVDGNLPYNEARGVLLTRRWVQKDAVRRDNQDNDIRPSLKEEPAVMTARLYSSDGLYAEPLSFYFSAGEHTLTLRALREPMAIERLRLVPPAAQPEAAASQAGQTAPLPTIKVQGEAATAMSDQTLYPLADTYNSLTEPFEIGKTRINHIGGYSWRQTGQWIEWTFDVPREGDYQLIFRAQQNYLVGLPVTREITLDGETPCAAMKSAGFPYASEWYLHRFGQEGAPALLHLTEGAHTLRMRVTLGDLADTVRRVRQVASDLTTLYGKVIMITGTVPDSLRDYQLEKRLAGIGDEFTAASRVLREEVERIGRLAGGRVAEAETLERLALQLDSLAQDPDTLPSRLDNFRENLSSLSSWILSITEQPLDIDYFLLADPGYQPGPANPSFWQSLSDGAASFFLSFTRDYTNLGDVYGEDEAITVWAALGQEQAATLKTLIDDTFTPETGIKVNLNILASSDALLYAASESTPPDVVIGVGGSLPVDYGIRTALIDLSQFPDYPQVAEQFYPSALTPFTYENAVYALPLSQTFPIMFYRTDMFHSLGLDVPQTWDDVYALIARLQEKNLTMGAGGFFDMFLLQNGGTYYTEDNTRCLLNSPQGVASFEQYTEMYTNYGLPQEYDFYNRFRTGEMPIGIADFTTYNNFSVAAPEIKGLWSVAPVPGTLKEDGTIDRSVTGGATACVMFSQARHVEEGWQFLKWFLSADAQIAYGRQLEAVLGSGARYASANRQAMDGLSWPSEVYSVILEQWDSVVGIPVIPGSYYVTRHMNNAFREVVSMGVLPREALDQYVDTINSEIRKKREEFGLPMDGEVNP